MHYRVFHIALLTVVFFLIYFQNKACSQAISEQSVVHEISLSDPVKKTVGLATYSIIEQKGKDGFPQQFYTDVESVYCFDSICKVVPVRLFWNILGNYQHYQLDSNYKLEKNEGKPFTPEDYKSLHRILQDKNSAFREISIPDISKSNSTEGVDAVSSATTIVLPEEATIEGATLTCYTLWHWANGAVCDSIRNRAGAALSIEMLNGFLLQDDEYKQFAIEQLTRRMNYNEEIVRRITNTSLVDTNRWCRLQLSYFEQSPDSIYFPSLSELVKSGNSVQRNAVLKSLLNTNRIAPEYYYKDLASWIQNTDSYQTVDLFLKLMESKNENSDELVRLVFPFLNKNILIARRAYWFLKNQSLTESQKRTLNVFFSQKQDYF